MAGELERLARQEDLDARCGAWRPSLVICPKAMLYTWAGWFAQKMPELAVITIDPRTPATRKRFQTAVRNQTHQVYVLHYEGLKLLYADLHEIHWLHVVADEAHRISNKKTQNSKAVRGLIADYRTALTATPADRDPTQLWSILNFIQPKTWTSFWDFKTRYASEYYDPNGDGRRLILGVNPVTLPELQAKLQPYTVRRKKRDVYPDRQPPQYKQVWVDLSPKQRKVYDDMRTEMLAWVGEHEDEPLQAAVVIAQLIRLQQICLATPSFRTREIQRQTKCWLPGREHPGDCVQNKRSLEAGEEPLPTEPMWHGRYHTEEVTEIILEDPSSKIDAALDVVRDLHQQGEQVVVFSQFTRAIDLFTERATKAGIDVGKYTGGTRYNTRVKIEKEFQAGELPVFAAQFEAGGVGLNLQTASNVVFLDRAWPARSNIQAEGRVDRIGQLAPVVTVTDIMARHTIDRGRHQRFIDNWHGIQKLLGDTHFDWTHEIYDPIEEPESIIV